MSNKRNVDQINSNNNNSKPIKKNKIDDDPLDSILGEYKTTQQGKNNSSSSSRFGFSIENVTNRIIELVQNGRDIDHIEVEGRIGLYMAVNNAFRPGMVPEDWEHIYRTIGNKKQSVNTRETDYLYHDGIRITFDEDSQTCIRKDNKIDRTTFEQSTNLVYDFRLQVAFEDSLPPPLSLPSGYLSKREKTRYTFKEENWKIDLTHVRVENFQNQQQSLSQLMNQNQHENTYELEVELYPSAIKSCIKKTTLTELLNNFVTAIKSLITTIQPPGFQSFPDLSMEKVNTLQEIDALREKVFEYIPSANANRFDTFPGSMPINFGKKHFHTVQTKEYYVSEKTDGVRYMLLVIGSNAYFIDRKFEFYLIKDYPMDILGNLYGKGTLLDGEMIRNHEKSTPVYLVFDIMAIENKSVTHLSLSERLGIIGLKIVQVFREKSDKPNVPPLPFSVIGKAFFKKNKISDVFSCIKDLSNGERIFIDKRRNHFTDGVIFTPDEPYFSYTVNNLFKWKYMDKWTIDFKVQERPNKGWFLSCVGNNNTEVDCREVHFSESDLVRLRKEYLRSRDPSTIIAECSFQPKYGTWKFHQVRHDKKKGNYISIVMDTMESIAENLTPEELKYRIPLKPEQDHWEDEIQKLRSSLLANMNRGSSSSNNQHH